MPRPLKHPDSQSLTHWAIFQELLTVEQTVAYYIIRVKPSNLYSLTPKQMLSPASLIETGYRGDDYLCLSQLLVSALIALS